MRFRVHGGFEIARKPNRLGDYGKPFWMGFDDQDADLANACGCYVFALKNGDNILPWYVGKTERGTFRTECFTPQKIVYYNEVLHERNGTPMLFLLARMTKSGQRLSKPSKRGHKDVDFLESMLIGIALERNRDLMNVRKTKLLREMKVPGVINSPQSPPTLSERALKLALGLS